MRAIALVAVAALVSACAPNVRIAAPPPELTECAEWPDAPDLPAYDWTTIEAARAISRTRDQMMLAYATAGFSAWADCKADVAGVKAWGDEVE